jgi:lactate/malate dehydrogenase family protein
VKIGMIGSGAVGSACLVALVVRGSAREIVILDRDRKRARAVAMDIGYGAPLASVVDIGDGDYPDLAGAEVVIISAGINEKSGGATDRSDPAGRLRLLDANVGVYRDILPRLSAVIPEAQSRDSDSHDCDHRFCLGYRGGYGRTPRAAERVHATDRLPPTLRYHDGPLVARLFPRLAIGPRLARQPDRQTESAAHHSARRRISARICRLEAGAGRGVDDRRCRADNRVSRQSSRVACARIDFVA